LGSQGLGPTVEQGKVPTKKEGRRGKIKVGKKYPAEHQKE